MFLVSFGPPHVLRARMGMGASYARRGARPPNDIELSAITLSLTGAVHVQGLDDDEPVAAGLLGRHDALHLGRHEVEHRLRFTAPLFDDAAVALPKVLPLHLVRPFDVPVSCARTVGPGARVCVGVGVGVGVRVLACVC